MLTAAVGPDIFMNASVVAATDERRPGAACQGTLRRLAARLGNLEELGGPWWQ